MESEQLLPLSAERNHHQTTGLSDGLTTVRLSTYLVDSSSSSSSSLLL